MAEMGRSPISGNARPPWSSRFLTTWTIPAAASAAFALIAVTYTVWWYPVVYHLNIWPVPGDCWTSYFAASALIHGHLGRIYGRQNGLIAFPGIAVVLAPSVAISRGLHLWIGAPYTAVSTPTAWLALEPIDLLAGCLALFSFDAVARRLRVSRPRRAFLAMAEVIALWDLLIYQWHPEDAFAVALGLWALLAALDGRWRRAGWLMGAGIAFQPLLLLALVVVIALAKRKEIAGIVVRSIVPAVVLVSGPLIANPSRTLRAIVDQPNSTVLNRSTPWVHLAPHLAHGMVASGPARSVAVVAAAVSSWLVCRRNPRIEVCVWMLAVCFATRVFFEPVMVSYYMWPALAVAVLIASRGSRFRFASTCALVTFSTFYVHEWRAEWKSWTILVVSIGAALVVSRPAKSSAPMRMSPSRGAGRTSEEKGHEHVKELLGVG
ncbi:MAG: hypothetical protein WAM97_15210 [Acidimicrobiales bacterium]